MIKYRKENLNGKQLNCLVSQPIEYRPLTGHEVTVWKHRSAKPMTVYPASRVLIFSTLYFRSISMAVLGNRYDSHEKTRKEKKDKIRNLS